MSTSTTTSSNSVKQSSELLFAEKANAALASLGLSVAAEHLDTLCQQAAAQDWSYTRLVAALLSGEVEARHKRAVELNLKFAKFPLIKRLEDFDFAAQPGLDRRLLDELATGRYLSEGRNLIFLGPPGVGASGLARAKRTWRCRWATWPARWDTAPTSPTPWTLPAAFPPRWRRTGFTRR